MDEYGQLRLKAKQLFCVRWQKMKLELSPICKSAFDTSYLNEKIYQFKFDISSYHIFAEKKHGKSISRFYLGYSAKNSYDDISLFTIKSSKSLNASLNKWKLKWVIYESQEPSTEPSPTPTLSQIPSLVPTTPPSASPSAMPSPSPTAKPSPSPTVSQTPTTEPSLLPTVEPSMEPSGIPSGEPSLQPSDEVGLFVFLFRQFNLRITNYD
jgi:hypothetical protein